MAKIQSYDQLTVDKYVSPSVTASAPRVIDTTQPILQGVNNLNKGLIDYQNSVDKTFSDEAYLQFQKERNKLFHDPNEGFFTLSGKNAYNAKDKAVNEYNKLVAKYASQMRGVYGDALKQRLEQTKVDDYNQIDTHVGREFKKYKLATLEDGINTSAETMGYNYTDFDKVDKALEDGIAYAVMSANEVGEQPNKYVKVFTDKAVTNMVSTALENEDVEGATKVLERYGDRVEGIRSKLAASIAKKKQELLNRDKQKRISEAAIDIYGKSSGDVSVAIDKVESSNMPADEKMATISKIISLHSIDNAQRAEVRDEIMKEVNDHVLAGKSVNEWVADNQDKWHQLSYSQQYQLMSRFNKPQSGSSKSVKDVTLSKSNPSLSAWIESSIKNGDKGQLEYLYRSYKDEIPNKIREKIEIVLNTDNIKPIAEKQLKEIPQVAVILNNLDDDEKSQFLLTMNALYIESQKQSKRTPTSDDLVSFARMAMIEAKDTGDPYYERYAEKGVNAVGVDTKGIIYNGLRETAVVHTIDTFNKIGINLTRDQAGKMIDMYSANNNYKIPNPYEIVDMVSKEMSMRRPIVLKLKTGGYLSIDRFQGGEYIEDDNELINMYKNDNTIGVKFNTMDEVNKHILQKEQETLNSTQAQNQVQSEPVILTSKMRDDVINKANERLTSSGFAEVPVRKQDTSVKEPDDKVKPVESKFDKAMKEGRLSAAKQAHDELISMMKNKSTASPYVAKLITENPLSTDEEKQAANDWLMVYKYGR